jgi:hypothetical protein
MSVVRIEQEMLCCLHYTGLLEALQMDVFLFFPPLCRGGQMKFGWVSTGCASIV